MAPCLSLQTEERPVSSSVRTQTSSNFSEIIKCFTLSHVFCALSLFLYITKYIFILFYWKHIIYRDSQYLLFGDVVAIVTGAVQKLALKLTLAVFLRKSHHRGFFMNKMIKFQQNLDQTN